MRSYILVQPTRTRIYDVSSKTLTTERRAALDALKEKWAAYRLLTDPADFEGAEGHVSGMFKALDLAAPEFFFRVQSPAGLRACMFLMHEHEREMRELAAEIVLNKRSLDEFHNSFALKVLAHSHFDHVFRKAINAGIRSCIEGFVRNVREHGPSKKVAGASEETMAWLEDDSTPLFSFEQLSRVDMRAVQGQDSLTMAMYLEGLTVYPELPHDRADDPEVQAGLAVSDAVTSALLGLYRGVYAWSVYKEDRAAIFMDRPKVVRNSSTEYYAEWRDGFVTTTEYGE